MKRNPVLAAGLATLLYFVAAGSLWSADFTTDSFQNSFLGGDIFVTYLMALGLGSLAAFTPCILPMVPIVLSIFGAEPGAPLRRKAALSLVYIQGMALLYTILGILAAVSGSVFGSHNSNVWLNGFLVVFFIYLGLVFGGYVVLPVPRFVQNLQTRYSHKGYLPAFVMGSLSGVVAASCSAPAYFVILDQIRRTAATADSLSAVIYGFSVSYVFAVGIGLPFIAMGIFGVRLPRSGPWQTVLKRLGALVLFTTALFYLTSIFPALKLENLGRLAGISGDSFVFFNWSLGPAAFFFFMSGLTLMAIVYLLFPPLHLEPSRLRLSSFFIVGVIASFLTGSAVVNIEPRRLADNTWLNKELDKKGCGVDSTRLPYVLKKMDAGQNKFVQAAKTLYGPNRWPACRETWEKMAMKPVLIDFWAEWCAECKVLEKEVLRSPDLSSVLENYHMVKVDVTEGTPAQDKVMKDFGVLVLPTLKLLDRGGKVVSENFNGSSISTHRLKASLESLLCLEC